MLGMNPFLSMARKAGARRLRAHSSKPRRRRVQGLGVLLGSLSTVDTYITGEPVARTFCCYVRMPYGCSMCSMFLLCPLTYIHIFPHVRACAMWGNAHFGRRLHLHGWGQGPCSPKCIVQSAFSRTPQLWLMSLFNCDRAFISKTLLLHTSVAQLFVHVNMRNVQQEPKACRQCAKTCKATRSPIGAPTCTSSCPSAA